MRCIHFDNGIKASFAGLVFDNCVSEPVKVTIRLEKSNMYFGYDFLRNVVCFYDVHTQKVWMDEKFEMADSLCSYVKGHMDAIFSDANESEKHLLEILCMSEGVVLGEHAMFFKSPQYGLSYQEGRYVLEIPENVRIYTKEEDEEYERRITNSKLHTELAHWLIYITVRNPSRLNELYMVKREPGKRNGTKVVRECQRKLLAALSRAEESISVVNAYRESM